MPLTADNDIARVLCSTRTIALLGASDNPRRASHEVMQFLLARGYEVFPVNPGLAGQTLLGRRVYARLADIPTAIDMVDVFRNSIHLQEVVDDAINANVKIVWTQLGVVDDNAAATAERAGLEVVMNHCPVIEWPRLQAAGLLA